MKTTNSTRFPCFAKNKSKREKGKCFEEIYFVSYKSTSIVKRNHFVFQLVWKYRHAIMLCM